MREYPKIGTHVRAMRYLRGSVADGTHAGPDITFTGELVGTPATGVRWVAINTDRALLPEETAILECTGGRILTRRYAGGGQSVLIAADVLTSWTFEPIEGQVEIHVTDSSITRERHREIIREIHALLSGPADPPKILLHIEDFDALPPARRQEIINDMARAGRMNPRATSAP